MPASPLTIADAKTGSSATVLPHLGFNCFSWRPQLKLPDGAETREMLWAESGFDAADKKPSRSGVPLLFPFPGRIRGGVFEFEGKRHEVSDRADGLGNAIHGFVIDAVWRVVDRADDAVTAVFQPSVDAPGTLDQWTGDYALRATYRVAAGRLDFEFEANNVGQTPLPFGFGTHAYFRLPLGGAGDGGEETTVVAPVDAEWAAAGLVPSGETLPLGELGGSLPEGGPLARREFDTPYRFREGATETRLTDPHTGVTVSQRFDTSMRCCVIYTPNHREAVCLEPYTCVPNPFELEASGVESGLRVLAPGAAYRTAITLEASVASLA
ncbi:MAG: aldose 1-epimerase [Planctomycetota bacterium]